MPMLYSPAPHALQDVGGTPAPGLAPLLSRRLLREELSLLSDEARED